MKKIKPKAFHTSPEKMATGSFYGSGIKNPSGKLISSHMGGSSEKSRKMGKPPRSYA